MNKKLMKALLSGILVVGTVLPTYLVLSSKIERVDFSPDHKPQFIGPLAINSALESGIHLGKGALKGPEGTAIDENGFIYTGTLDGHIYKVSLENTVEKYAYIGGHPVGMDFDSHGNLYVCVPDQGLFMVTPERETKQVVKDIGFSNDVKVASDGMVYFTDSTTKFAFKDYMLDMMEAGSNGRLLRYNPINNDVEVILEGLHFANGLTFSEDESYLLVNESSRSQTRKVWLKGSKKGKDEVFVSNLPGYPDGITTTNSGNYLITFFAKRMNTLDFLHKYPLLKQAAASLPSSMMPTASPHGLMVLVSGEGEYLESYHDESGEVSTNITSARQVGDKVVLGSLTENQLVIVDIDNL
ncbi:SMP-30/gluconolactonase/LRE family protein [Photobacterium sp. BZF1]|uniref:SMP-30/gluconolactonase/LRE family protein n=1 Tax=Photobacterium sp. BZF1 TaxID=1904457 RepID=UPI001653CED0|nr:SMP-30/gluconolactonase/LRE family protein [Photobacterium sp. BZF1]MBC7006754.1 SMP-30/gluconolactonase/LRE family protein [Photobacterium sp. BZF1]